MCTVSFSRTTCLAENEIWIGQVDEESGIVVVYIGAKQQWALLVDQQFEMREIPRVLIE